eukprot:1677530-Amphidinium_carterae.1
MRAEDPACCAFAPCVQCHEGHLAARARTMCAVLRVRTLRFVEGILQPLRAHGYNSLWYHVQAQPLGCSECYRDLAYSSVQYLQESSWNTWLSSDRCHLNSLGFGNPPTRGDLT